MILFKKLRWKNFLSTGDNWTEIDFLSNKTTLVVGHNGSGKSTMLDALAFALFGKPHRNINKPQLVNSINNKDCRVEVSFRVSGSEFHIVRGIKPNVFEVYKDGNLINQEAHSRDYQKILEQNILKLNHKSFHQIVVLGSSSFVPFMQLTAQHRREVIEDLLDINIFSKMNTILKEKNSVLKDQIRDVDYRINVVDTKIDAQKKYIAEINRINEDLKEQKQASIAELEAEKDKLSKDNEDLNLKIQHQSAIHTTVFDKAKKKLSQLQQYQTQFNTDIKVVVKEAKFFEDNSTCPTCSQEISDDVKKEKTEAAKERAKSLSVAAEKCKEEIEQTTETLTAAQSGLDQVQAWNATLSNNNNTIARINKQVETLYNEINNLTDTTSDMSVAKADLQSFVDEKNAMIDEKHKNSEQYQYNIAIAEMLKDTGIKTKIVKQYLPVINKLVNQYLQTLDFFVHFDLDESFGESIRSRHRDAFSYTSFSEGEKQRIDLSLLFTWRQVAKMKNSVATNLLILDETFDSSLDYEGVDNLMKIIHGLDEKTNVFVISHKGDILDGKFENKLEFVKEKNFSKIK